jgi:hypothetical protein
MPGSGHIEYNSSQILTTNQFATHTSNRYEVAYIMLEWVVLFEKCTHQPEKPIPSMLKQ